MTTRHISQFRFSFYRNRSVQCDFSGGQITGDGGLLPLRAFDERHHLTRDWAVLLSASSSSASVRNGDRDDFGLVIALPRNMHADLRGKR